MFSLVLFSDSSATKDLLAAYVRAYKPLMPQIALYLNLPENHHTLDLASFTIERFGELFLELSSDLQKLARQRLQQLPKGSGHKPFINVEGQFWHCTHRPVLCCTISLTNKAVEFRMM